MAQIGNIVINDGATTPVAHTFIPVRVSGGTTAEYRENQSGLPLVGQGQMSISVRTLKSGVMQCHVQVATPALEQITGNNTNGYTASPKVAYTPLGGVTFNFDPRSTTQQRKDVRTLIINALANAQVVDAVDNLNPPY